MKERPILFSAPMIRAILAGAKTQTRRVAKVPKSPWPWEAQIVDCVGLRNADGTPASFAPYPALWNTRSGDEVVCPYGAPGDRLLVAKEIPTAPNDDYCAGSDGLIYSRTRYAGFGRKDRCDWYPLVGHKSSKGYSRVSLCHENKKVTRSIHTLVCEAFYGPSPFDGAQVRHLDGNAENNEPSNLAWGTQAENWTDRRAHGRGCEGEKHHASKLSNEERAHIRWAISNGLCSRRQAARALGMSQASISVLVQGCELRETVVSEPGDRIPRITLEITDVRVQRLQAITEEDARAEGFGVAFGPGHFARSFRSYWDSLYGEHTPFASSPWVWAISFRRVTP